MLFTYGFGNSAEDIADDPMNVILDPGFCADVHTAQETWSACATFRDVETNLSNNSGNLG